MTARRTLRAACVIVLLPTSVRHCRCSSPVYICWYGPRRDCSDSQMVTNRSRVRGSRKRALSVCISSMIVWSPMICSTGANYLSSKWLEPPRSQHEALAVIAPSDVTRTKAARSPRDLAEWRHCSRSRGLCAVPF